MLAGRFLQCQFPFLRGVVPVEELAGAPFEVGEEQVYVFLEPPHGDVKLDLLRIRDGGGRRSLLLTPYPVQPWKIYCHTFLFRPKTRGISIIPEFPLPCLLLYFEF